MKGFLYRPAGLLVEKGRRISYSLGSAGLFGLIEFASFHADDVQQYSSDPLLLQAALFRAPGSVQIQQDVLKSDESFGGLFVVLAIQPEPMCIMVGETGFHERN